MMQMATKRGARASILLQVTTLLMIVFAFLAQYSTADEVNKMTMLRGRVNYESENKYYTTPNFQMSRSAVDEPEDGDVNHEPHPADELLQSQDADGSQSYILGGY